LCRLLLVFSFWCSVCSRNSSGGRRSRRNVSFFCYCTFSSSNTNKDICSTDTSRYRRVRCPTLTRLIVYIQLFHFLKF
jgi:hypothetical protein